MKLSTDLEETIRRVVREEVADLVAEQERPLLNVKDVADRLCVTTWTVYQLLDRQEIESRYIGRRRLVVAESLRAYIENLPNYPST